MKSERESPNQKVLGTKNVSKNERAIQLSILKDAFSFVTGASDKSLIKFFLIIILTTILIVSGKFLYNMAGSDRVMESVSKIIESKREFSEKEGIEIRQDIVTPGIQKELKILCYSLNADRVFIFELHNGKKSAGGLPFVYADMSYEEVNKENSLEYVGLLFQNIPLTLYKYPHYLFKEKYIFESLEEISEIDLGFAKHVQDLGGKYLAGIYITLNGEPLGFLCASFHTKPVLSEEVIREKIEKSARILNPLLDLETQVKQKNGTQD
jgi:hypothetical protein